MKKPKFLRVIFYVSLALYAWYLASALILPMSLFIYIPNFILLSIYKLIDFPVSILSFILCVSIISTTIVFQKFHQKKILTKIFLIEGISFVLYFITPLLATALLLAILAFGISHQIPTIAKVSFFLNDLFLFSSILFILTAILNIATQKIIGNEITKDNI